MYSFRVITLSLLCLSGMLFSASTAHAQELKATLTLKTPGNEAVPYELKLQGQQLVSKQTLPIDVTLQQTEANGDKLITVNVKAKKNVYFNLGFALMTGLKSGQSEFYMPGLW